MGNKPKADAAADGDEVAKPKAEKKKVAIEEVDSSAEAAKPKAKKKIAIEEVDSSAEAAKPKAKKKIVVEEVDSSAQVAPASPPKSPPATGGARAVPAFLGAKVKPPPKT